MKEALDVKKLSKKFEEFALQNISFSIPYGSIMGLVGQNGSGKTTTIKLILNLLKRQAGSITVLGMDNIDNERAYKERIGVVFDSHFFVDEWKMTDVEKAMGLFYKYWDSRIFYQHLSRFQIGKNKRVKELSKGMQMKLMLAAAFSHKAELLILDEPTSGLDPVSRDELLDVLLDYTKDKKHSVLFSTHITPDLSKIADRITFLNKGSMIFTGKKETFTERYLIVNGTIGQLTPELKGMMISTKIFSGTFEGMIMADSLPRMSHLQKRPATIDDIIVFASY